MIYMESDLYFVNPLVRKNVYLQRICQLIIKNIICGWFGKKYSGLYINDTIGGKKKKREVEEVCERRRQNM